jgi:diphosphomevalonate decarboxylase
MDFCYHCRNVGEISKKVNKRGEVTWQSPSNIALIKYWGKKGFQIPANASLSMTLSESVTKTTIKYAPADNHGKVSFDFIFEGNENPAFAAKLQKFFDAIVDDMPFLKRYHLEIHSTNTFPHSAGIASSASAMSALALCLCSIDRQIDNRTGDEDESFLAGASHIARIGSGSAARSVYGGFASWGISPVIAGSSDLYATPLAVDIHPDFMNLKDTILIISKSEKKVSSRAGHNLMEAHPYSTARYDHAENNLRKLLDSMKKGDMAAFTEIVENEALTLHAMMIASSPGFFLVENNTLQAIDKIRNFRKTTGIPVCFTLDAGPNVHVIYPEKHTQEVKQFIKSELATCCESGFYIDDFMGKGPEKLKENE